MRLGFIATLIAALIVAIGAGSARGVPMAITPFGGTVECFNTLVEPSFKYYAPWNQRYVETKAYASCSVPYGTLGNRLPYKVDGIGVEVWLYRDSGLVDQDGNLIKTQVGYGKSTVTFTSLTSTKAVHICGTYTDEPYNYTAISRAYFVKGGQEVWIDAETQPIPIVCS